MLISPIMMIPSFQPQKALQEMYLKQSLDMSLRKGPLTTNGERQATRVSVAKKDYEERSTLMAAPILFQIIRDKTTKCPYNYSSTFVTNLYEKALVDKCDASIYKCDESLLKNAEDVMACLVESTWNESSPAPQHLGANATEFRNMTGYAGN